MGLGKTLEAGQAGQGNGSEASGPQSLGLCCGEGDREGQAGGLALLAAEQGLGPAGVAPPLLGVRGNCGPPGTLWG